MKNYFLSPSQIIEFVSEGVAKEYGHEKASGKVCSFAFIGGTSGKILSEKIAILIGKTGEHKNNEVFYVVSPTHLDDYHDPLIELMFRGHNKAGFMVDFRYPDGKIKDNELNKVVEIIKKKLEDLEINYLHIVN